VHPLRMALAATRIVALLALTSAPARAQTAPTSPPALDPRAVTLPPSEPLVAAPSQAPGDPPPAKAEPPKPEEPKPEEKPKDPPWYERIKIRGYTQFRYNRIPSFNENDELVNDQGDRYLGKGNGFGIRRARVILYGDVHHHVSIYLQTDFASVIDTQYHVPTVRDWYTDIFFDKKKTFRARVGQSKVPFGFENMQSSQNRLALDRNDALNSAVKDERDLGVFLYWAPAEIRDRFKYLVDNNLKGSGDYGVVGVGAYNGQTANRAALEDNMHGVARVTWPFLFGKQFVEVGGGGYFGQYRISTSDSAGVEYSTPDGRNQRDWRVHGTLVVYPQPFGFQAEGNYGMGPAQGKPGADDRTEIEERKIYGGYAQVMYKIDDLWHTVSLIPYARGTYYDGGKKFETNVPRYHVKELEIGLEWQFLKALELTLAYDMSDRTSSRAPYYREKGHITRVQLQVNY
jgi:hypothetical protein